MTTLAAAIALLTGRLTDGEYFRSLEADRFGLFYSVPRRGWSHRRPFLARALAELVTLLGALLVLVFILIACSLAGPLPR